MFKEYYAIADSKEKKFIIMQDDEDGRFAILKSMPKGIIECLKEVNCDCEYLPKRYEYGEDYIIEESVEGTKLADIIENGSISFCDFKKIICDLCIALDALHKVGLCHMDIAPENIIKSNGSYILIDFSASRLFGTKVVDISYGTRKFCSPEHFGFDTVSSPSDVYSIAKFLEYLLEYVTEVNKKIFKGLIEQGTTVDKNQRIQRVCEFKEKFDVVCRQHTPSVFKDAKIYTENETVYGGWVLTEELLNSLSSVEDLSDFIKENTDKFVEIAFADYFGKIIQNKGLKKSEVIKNSGIERTYGYQLLNGTKKPSRDKLIQLCMGANLTYEETQMALKYNGFKELYPKNKRDCIIIYALKTNKSIMETEELLDRFNQETLNNA